MPLSGWLPIFSWWFWAPSHSEVMSAAVSVGRKEDEKMKKAAASQAFA